MSQIELPKRTAGEFEFKNGKKVWVQTLSSIHRNEVDRAARLYAAEQTTGILKGTPGYKSFEATISSQTAEQQALYIVSENLRTFASKANEKYPNPEEPEQGAEEAPHDFTARIADWQFAIIEADKKRGEYIQECIASETERNMALTAAKRKEACYRVYFEREFYNAFADAFRIETLLRAVRTADDHLMRYFDSAAQIKDLWDEEGQPLFNFYQSLELPGGADAVPT